MTTAHTILYFDGVCNLCNRTVQWVLKHDRTGTVLFAPLQNHPEIQQEEMASVVLLHKGQYYYGSDAVLRLVPFLGWPWQWMRLAYLLPKFLRDRLYTFVAKRRYKWFGRRAECRIPDPGDRQRFLS